MEVGYRTGYTEAIAILPEKCREVFVLSKIEGLKNREIAEKLNISEKTVERHMSIALSKLREELDWLLQIILFFSFSHWAYLQDSGSLTIR